MRKTFMNIAIALEERRKMREALSKSKERKSRFARTLLISLGAVLLGFLAFETLGRELARKPVAPQSADASKWVQLDPSSSEFSVVAKAAEELCAAVAAEGPGGLSGRLGRAIPPELAADFAESVSLLKGGAPELRLVKLKTGDPAGRCEALCQSASAKGSLRLSFIAESGSLKLVGADFVK